MKSEDGKPLPEFQAGQYISLKVRIPDSEYTHIRQYSLSDMPGKDYYRISVKKMVSCLPTYTMGCRREIQ